MLVETVGVGQVEVEVAGKADTTVVVVNPGWGDSVQANKAGLMEIADVFVDQQGRPRRRRRDPPRPGADARARRRRRLADDESPTAGGRRSSPPWRPTGDGVAELWDAVAQHRHHADGVGAARAPPRRAAARGARRDRRPPARASEPAQLCGEERWRGAHRCGASTRELDPWAAADEMIAPTEAAARSDP